ncbi:MAG TPA: hypothetical protein ENO10_05425 [Salinimicrobium catena]|uniref:Uncharacterized protein n=1 Tax=Salinimicrobium catena TaxID=390640 RepID=A0A7C2MEC7_9FLAO|nr:hypothetical protein [Salinimicrobium catena]
MTGCADDVRIAQTDLQKVNEMPDLPVPYKMLDWYEKTKNFDEIIFNHPADSQGNSFIWIDTAGRNFPQPTFGLFTVIGDVRQGPDVNNGEFHESINSLGALLSAGLVGIDKTNQHGFNYVKMVQNYFNRDNSWNIMMNNTSAAVAHLGGGYGRDWWYDVFPNVLYYAVSDVFPGVSRADSLQRIIAEQFFKADSVLDGNYDYSYFDYSRSMGKRNQIPYQQDAAAGHAWVLYSAYQKFGDSRYLDGAVSSLDALYAQDESRFYEVLMPFGAYTAARLNAEKGMHYDILKLLSWTFDGCTAKDGRTGWGIIADRWGEYDVSGILGNTIQDGGYGFLMNTFDMAWPLVPMVRYEPEYAMMIGKWMLHAASAARLFYPYEIPDKNQWLPQEKAITKNIIAYEGLKKTDVYNKKELEGISPVALGDGPNWVIGQPEISMFSIYGSAHVGIFGSIIRETNVEKILQLNCLATDFYRKPACATYLYYNPYDENKQIEYFNEDAPVDLYDAISHRIVARHVTEEGCFDLPAKSAMLIVVVPSESQLEKRGERIMLDTVVIAYK